jgi:hypothetical protein
MSEEAWSQTAVYKHILTSYEGCMYRRWVTMQIEQTTLTGVLQVKQRGLRRLATKHNKTPKIHYL